MKWPMISRKQHELKLRNAECYQDGLIAQLNNLRITCQEAEMQGYARAMKEGRSQVREWAVDASYNIFNTSDGAVRGLATAAFQTAIGIFSPPKPHHPYWRDQSKSEELELTSVAYSYQVTKNQFDEVNLNGSDGSLNPAFKRSK